MTSQTLRRELSGAPKWSGSAGPLHSFDLGNRESGELCFPLSRVREEANTYNSPETSSGRPMLRPLGLCLLEDVKRSIPALRELKIVRWLCVD